MRENKEKAMREYKNIFTNEGSDQQIIKRSVIIRNSKLRPPIMGNDGGRKFVLAEDPARTSDNSICTVAEVINDPEVGYRMEIANSINFVDLGKKKKTPMKTPDQIKYFKQLLLDYNGKTADYENIMAVLIDAGAGGAGVSAWGDGLIEDWTDSNGKKHPGLIDATSEEYSTYISKYPNARDIVRLLSPHKLKKAMFEALIEMMNLDLISFTDSYDSRGFLSINDTDKEGDIKTITHKLSVEEELALVNIDLMKEELVSIYAFKSSNGNVRYDLPPDKLNKIGDDRAYTLAMLAWYLQQLRRENITSRKKVSGEATDFLLISRPTIHRV
jgi:hypothetical protein